MEAYILFYTLFVVLCFLLSISMYRAISFKGLHKDVLKHI